MQDDRFNKVFIGSGLMAEIFLHALIHHKGESPEDFYVIGKDSKRCLQLMNKYNIRATTNLNSFVSKAKVVVLAVDICDLENIPEIVAQIRDQIPPDALINSVTAKLKIAEIEKFFPNHPVMRLSINFSAISGSSVGTFFCGSINPGDTMPVAKFLIESFGDLIEVESEEDFEKVHDIIFAQNCSNYLAINCFIDSIMKLGFSPEVARKITVGTYRGLAETFEKKYKDDILMRITDFDGVFDEGLQVMKNFGMEDALKNAHKIDTQVIKVNLERLRNNALSPEDVFKFRYNNLTK